MIATYGPDGPIPGAYPNITLWVTPIYGTSPTKTQDEFEACLLLAISAFPQPPASIQIVSGSYGLGATDPNDPDVLDALNSMNNTCLG